MGAHASYEPPPVDAPPIDNERKTLHIVVVPPAGDTTQPCLTPHPQCLALEAKVKTASPVFDRLPCLGKLSPTRSGGSMRCFSSDDESNGSQMDSATGTSLRLCTSPAMIRRHRLEQLEADRPSLSSRQVEMITRTWYILREHLDDVGLDMFERLFRTYPDIKGAFGPFKSVSSASLRYSEEMRAHGLRVLSTVETIITNQSQPEKAIRHMHDLGRRHITYDAKVDYVDILGQQFLFAIEPVLNENWNAEVEQAWADLFRFMAHVMKEAMMM